MIFLLYRFSVCYYLFYYNCGVRVLVLFLVYVGALLVLVIYVCFCRRNEFLNNNLNQIHLYFYNCFFLLYYIFFSSSSYHYFSTPNIRYFFSIDNLFPYIIVLRFLLVFILIMNVFLKESKATVQ